MTVHFLPSQLACVCHRLAKISGRCGQDLVLFDIQSHIVSGSKLEAAGMLKRFARDRDIETEMVPQLCRIR